MKSSKNWDRPCSCGCGHMIKAGDQITITRGAHFFLTGHESRDIFEDNEVHVKRNIYALAPSIELLQVPQAEVSELPMFKTEHVEQTSLF